MNRTEHLLTILAEECAEVAQRSSKALRFGLKEIEPGQSLTNEQRICYELNDLLGVVSMLGLLNIDLESIEAKKIKVETFLEYSRKQGTLT